MKTFLKALKHKRNRLVSRVIGSPQHTIVLKNKPLSVLALRQELMNNQLISNDGFMPEDIVDINANAIWNHFCDIFKRNEKNNIRFGQFSFFIEEHHVLAQLYEVSPSRFQQLLTEYCDKLGCNAEFKIESRSEVPGLVLNKVTIKHSYLSKDPISFIKFTQ